MSRRWLAALLLLAVTIIVTEPHFHFIDDEVTILNDAASPIGPTMARYIGGAGQHEHPPLYDLILHFWLRGTQGRMGWLRIPSITFYIFGLGALATAAVRFGSSGTNRRRALGCTAIFIGVLWPFGFHFGRVATWYSLSFALVSLLTVFYIDFVSTPNWTGMIKLLAAASALIYTSYYGWALVGCLAVDFAIERRGDWGGFLRWAAPGAAILFIIYLPMWGAFFAEIFGVVGPPQFGRQFFLQPAFCLYSLFVSESVAPWYWWIGVPMGVAAVGCVVLAWVWGEGRARRLLAYFVVLFVGMEVLGILETKRLLLIAPWLLIPLAVAVGEAIGPRRTALAGLIAATFLTGWVGIGLRRYYAAPRWLEPWPEVASKAAQEWMNGATIISNSPSFFLYLTYDLGLAGATEHERQRFEGFLGKSLHARNVFAMEDWVDRPSAPTGEVVLVRGVQFSAPGTAERAEEILTGQCKPAGVIKLYRDPGYEIKQRVFPTLQQPEWRVEVRRYECNPLDSRELR
jgi:hypothetical protein